METNSPGAIDKVRASHDGHTYHETWAVRSALELLAPNTTLIAIALEGFSVEDEEDLSNAATEIADLVKWPRILGPLAWLEEVCSEWH